MGKEKMKNVLIKRWGEMLSNIQTACFKSTHFLSNNKFNKNHK